MYFNFMLHKQTFYFVGLFPFTNMFVKKLVIWFSFSAHKKGCYIKEINDVIPYGRSNIAGHCMEVVCKEERTSYFA